MTSGGRARLCRNACIASFLSCALALPVWAQAENPWVDPPAKLSPVEPAPSAPPVPVAPPPATPAPVEAPPPAPRAEQASPPTDVAVPAPAPALAPPASAGVTEAPRPSVEEPQKKAGDQATVRRGPLPTPPEVTLGLKAELVTFAFLDFWSAPNAVTLKEMPSFYGEDVMFHGRHMSVQEVLKGKRRFARRWPEREYKPRRESMQIACDAQAEICNVRTVVDFMAASSKRRKRSEGTTTLDLGISFAEGRPIIASENSQVIARGVGIADDE